MSDSNCGCAGIKLLGRPNCVKQMTAEAKIGLMPMRDSDGERNGIPISDFDANGVLSEAKMLLLLDNVDASKRLNLTPDEFEEVAPSRSERITQTSSTGTIREILKGVKTYSAQLWNVPTAWSGLINGGNCDALGKYSIDTEGKFEGELSADGLTLYPKAIQVQSMVAEDFDATSTEGQYTMITYQLSRVANENQFFAFGADAFEIPWLSVTAPIQAVISQGATTNTDLLIYVDLEDFSFGDVEGYDDVADWTVTEEDLTPITLSSVDEETEGKYKFTITPSTPTTNVIISLVKVRTSASATLFQADAKTLITGTA